MRSLNRRHMLGGISALGAMTALGVQPAQHVAFAAQDATPMVAEGDYTINGWGITDADYAILGIDRAIEPSANGWQTKAITENPTTYEWWYFDIQQANGDTLTLTLSPQSTFGFMPRFGDLQGVGVLSYNTGGVQRTERALFTLDQFAAATDGLDVQAGPFSVTGDFESLHITGELNGIALDVTFTQRATPLRLGNGYFFVGSTDQWQGWFNPFPLAHATGTLTVDGVTTQLDANGYHDHQYGNIPIAEGMRGWFWARSVFDRYVTLSNEITLPERFGGGGAPQFWIYDLENREVLIEAFTYDNLTVTYGDIVPHPDPLHGAGYPSLTIYNYRNGDDRAQVTLVDQRVLAGQLEGNITDPQVWAYLTDLGINGVYYTRRQSEVTLDLDLPGKNIQDTVTGPSLHELEESGFPQYVLQG